MHASGHFEMSTDGDVQATLRCSDALHWETLQGRDSRDPTGRSLPRSIGGETPGSWQESDVVA